MKQALLRTALFVSFLVSSNPAIAQTDQGVDKIPSKPIDGSAVAIRISSNYCELSLLNVRQDRGNQKPGKLKSISVDTDDESEITKLKKLSPGRYNVESIVCQTGLYPNLYGAQLTEKSRDSFGSFTVNAGEISYLGDISIGVMSPGSKNKDPLFRSKSDVF